MPEKWKPFVQVGDELDRHYYEMCALTALRDGLRSGDIWVPGSRQYQDFTRYLLSASAFAELRDAGEAPVLVDTNFNAYLEERTALLVNSLDEVHGLVASGSLEGIKITREGFSVSPQPGQQLPEPAHAFITRVNATLPRIKITDLLVEVDRWTGFLEQFTHLRTGLPGEDRHDVLTVILADGINQGLTRMAESVPGSSLKRLSHVADWYVREECYSRALTEIVNQQHGVELGRIGARAQHPPRTASTFHSATRERRWGITTRSTAADRW